MARIAIVADDLTGANDTGIQFSKKGLTTIVMLSEQQACADVIVADSDSRRESPETAAKQVRETAAMLQKQYPHYWYKKIDSTLRGNVGAELEAMLSQLDFPFAVVCPAFPATGRGVAGGHLLVNGIPVLATEYSKDVLKPVRSSSIEEVIRLQADLKCGHLSISDLEKGPEFCINKVNDLILQDTKVIIADACSEPDLKIIGCIIGSYSTNPPLAVGSAGLADYLPDSWSGTKKIEQKPVLVLAGSVSQTTREQADILIKSTSCHVVQLELDKVLSLDARYRAMLIDNISDALTAGVDVLVRSADKPERIEEARAAGHKLDMTQDQVSAKIAEFFALLAREVSIRNIPMAGMILTGGDVAIRICRALEAMGMELVDEVSAGIPVARLSGGVADKTKVVTKAGGFGKPDALIKAVAKLKESKL